MGNIVYRDDPNGGNTPIAVDEDEVSTQAITPAGEVVFVTPDGIGGFLYTTIGGDSWGGDPATLLNSEGQQFIAPGSFTELGGAQISVDVITGNITINATTIGGLATSAVITPHPDTPLVTYAFDTVTGESVALRPDDGGAIQITLLNGDAWTGNIADLEIIGN